MDKEEALGWINGDRDMINLINQYPYDTLCVRVEQANAAKKQQAYWVLKAHDEGLVSGEDE